VTLPRGLRPPVLFLAMLVLQVGIHRLRPGPTLLRWPLDLSGVLPVAMGIALTIAGERRFSRAGIAVRPFSRSHRLVMDGPFRWSRNPMYLGLIIALVGTAMLLGSATPFVIPPVFAILLRESFIRAEEQWLSSQFGNEYRQYASRVRRWL
jgi:protein-S-isoprenylcysteine O-methyltransferase Ste14